MYILYLIHFKIFKDFVIIRSYIIVLILNYSHLSAESIQNVNFRDSWVVWKMQSLNSLRFYDISQYWVEDIFIEITIAEVEVD